MKTIHISILLILLPLFFVHSINAQVLISTDSDGIIDESAMLQIDSDTKGVLIPRVTTVDRNAITLTPGLLVYDYEVGAFFLYGKTDWINLSSSAEIWSQSSSNVYLTKITNSLGIGTNTPTSKLVVQADSDAGANDPLFQIKDKTGKTIMSVTSSGVRIYQSEDMALASSGGFAVGQYASLKSNGDEFFKVTPFQTTVNTLPPGNDKGKAGGFAVGQYSSLKGGTLDYNFYTNSQETRIYTGGDKTPVNKNGGKAVAGGFAVGQYGSLKADGDKYMHIDTDNIFIGDLAGVATTAGVGVNNVFIGNNAGAANIGGSGNIFIGNNAGSTVVNNNKLFIDNASSDSDVALISGDFGSTKAVNLNGRLRFNTVGNTITMPATRGALDQVLTANSGGIATWETVTDLFTFPTIPDPYVPPIIVVTSESLFNIADDDKIGTLIVKTPEGKEMQTYLPPIENNIDRVIKIKNSRPSGNIDLYTFKDSGDIIDGVSELPFLISPGETYTFQAEYDKETGQGTWYIIDYTSEALENLSPSPFLKITEGDYDFETGEDGPKVTTLILSGGDLSVLLPPAVLYPNRSIVIKNSDKASGNSIKGVGGDLIDGTSTLSINNPNMAFTLQSDGGSSWYVINRY